MALAWPIKRGSYKNTGPSPCPVNGGIRRCRGEYRGTVQAAVVEALGQVDGVGLVMGG